jgi:hypothetical protein
MARTTLWKPLAVLIAIVCTGSILWPSYRKFFIDEWRERILSGKPVVFLPDCPDSSGHFKCVDRYIVVFRKDQDTQWCASVRKNQEPKETTVCGVDPNARDFSRSWRYFDVEGIHLYYSWRGRALIPGVGYVGWLATPEEVQDRSAHPLSID